MMIPQLQLYQILKKRSEATELDGRSSKKYLIELDSRDRIVGQLSVDNNGQAQLTNTAFGNVDIDPKNIKNVFKKLALRAEFQNKC